MKKELSNQEFQELLESKIDTTIKVNHPNINNHRYLEYWLGLKKLCNWLEKDNCEIEENEDFLNKLIEFKILIFIPIEDVEELRLNTSYYWVFQYKPVLVEQKLINISEGFEILKRDVELFKLQSKKDVLKHHEIIRVYNENQVYSIKKEHPQLDFKKEIKKIEDEIRNVAIHTNNSKTIIQEYIDGKKAEYDKKRKLDIIQSSFKYVLSVDFELEIIDDVKYVFSEFYNRVFSFLENYEFKRVDVKTNHNKTSQFEKKNSNNCYSHKQVAIAYFVMGIPINSQNAKEILEKHTTTKSVQKFLTKRIINSRKITELSGSKTSDSKHLNDLNEAKRLIVGEKNKNAINDINRIITAYSTNYEAHY